jgi:hypothetical protein
MNENGAKVFDFNDFLKKKQAAATAQETIPQIAQAIMAMLIEGGYDAVDQLAALGVCGKAVRGAIAYYHGEKIADQAVRRAFKMSQHYQPQWEDKRRMDHRSLEQAIFEDGRCPHCGAHAKLLPDGNHQIKHAETCPVYIG